jgi:hypothetical protein
MASHNVVRSDAEKVLYGTRREVVLRPCLALVAQTTFCFGPGSYDTNQTFYKIFWNLWQIFLREGSLIRI